MADLKEACGVFGVYDFKGESIFPYVYWGLVSQNHRGHQSHGLITYNGDFHAHKALGLVPRMRSRKMRKWMTNLPGSIGIGNVRYTTSGNMDRASLYKDIQPTVVEIGTNRIAISYNGNIVNAVQLHEEINKSIKIEGTSDTELLCKKLYLELEKSKDLSKAVKKCIEDVEGAYSTIGITGDGELFAFRDSLGIKPLCIGFSEDKEIVAISSESVGLDINGLDCFKDEVKPGELIRITSNSIRREQLVEQERKALCSFEFAYFSRPDSMLNGTKKYVYEIRKDFGRNLGKTCEQSGGIGNLEVVIPVPETANDAGYGFHEETGLPLDLALRRHRYVTDRAFITMPRERSNILGKKINILGDRVSGKRIALIDDSIVRGDTTKNVIQKMKASGAKEIHIYITFPKIISPCFYGVDMATFGELIGTKREPSEIAEMIGAESLTYQNLEDFIRTIGLGEKALCLACITGKYPTPIAQKIADEKRTEFEKGTVEKKRIYE
ncbi:MAG: amidophosphoribosyltransferase [Thermoproteota archaeon]|nr:amidophosphoribosyltransferase [Thermoproteota archaeon]